MPEDLGNEVLMRMVDSKGDALLAEAQSVIDTKTDKLASDFTKGAFFTVDSFDFGMEVDDSEPEDTSADEEDKTDKNDPKKSKKDAKKQSVVFDKWKSSSEADRKKMTPFPIKMDAVRVERLFDRSSPVLFQACARSLSFRSATMIKRKITGDAKLMTFLRFDFKDVLVTKVGWDDAEAIKETLTFVFRSVTVQYRQQAHDGSLMAEATAAWKYTQDTRASDKQGNG